MMPVSVLLLLKNKVNNILKLESTSSREDCQVS